MSEFEQRALKTLGSIRRATQVLAITGILLLAHEITADGLTPRGVGFGIVSLIVVWFGAMFADFSSKRK